MINKFKLTLEGVPYEIERRGDVMLVNGHEFSATLAGNQLTVAGIPHTVEVKGGKAVVDGIGYEIEVQGLEEPKTLKKHKVSGDAHEETGAITAVMPGLVIRILKKEGQKVNAGETVIILEAMKMQNELQARVGGVVKSIHVKEGESVEMRQLMAVIEGPQGAKLP